MATATGTTGALPHEGVDSGAQDYNPAMYELLLAAAHGPDHRGGAVRLHAEGDAA